MVTKEKGRSRLPRINFRPLLFCALALCFGVFLYGKLTFGGFAFSDLFFLVFFLAVGVFPLTKRRIFAVLLCFVLFLSLGYGLSCLYSSRYQRTVEAGEYSLTGTVTSLASGNGVAKAELSDLFIDGEKAGGKCRVSLGEDCRLGDTLLLSVTLTPVSLEEIATDASLLSLYISDIRYTATVQDYQKIGVSDNGFLSLNARLRDTLQANMSQDEASVAYALLTGNSSEIDSDFLTAVRKGGIAHIFAVSGLHIGVLYAFAYAIFAPLKKYRVIPALALAFCYSGLCGFTVSSLRAVIMSGTLGVLRQTGRKTDFLNSISVATLITMILFPAQWFSVGFQLSFGAVVGLALFSGSLSSFFGKFLPKWLAGGLSSGIAVQLFTLPVTVEAFGYLSVWGFLLNLVLIPLMPVLFLGAVISSAVALCIPPLAGLALSVPEATLSFLIFVFSIADFSYALTGFALGGCAVLWLLGCVTLCRRFRASALAKGVLSIALAVAFTACFLYENLVFTGCKITVFRESDADVALIRTREHSVLLLDGETSLSRAKSFLAKNYTGGLDAVFVLCKNEVSALNVGAFLGADRIYAKDECETGLRESQVVFTDEVTLGEMRFVYESREKMLFSAENVLVEIDFTGEQAFFTQLFITAGGESLNYFLNRGTIFEKFGL